MKKLLFQIVLAFLALCAGAGCRDRDSVLSPAAELGALLVSVRFETDSLSAEKPAESPGKKISVETGSVSLAQSSAIERIHAAVYDESGSERQLLAEKDLQIDRENNTFSGSLEVASGDSRVVAVQAFTQAGVSYLGNSLKISVPAGGSTQTTVSLADFVPSVTYHDEVSQSGDFTIQWSGVPGAEGYIVYQSSEPGFTAFDSLVLAQQTSAVFDSRPRGLYYLRVRAFSAYGFGALSDTVSVRVTSAPDAAILVPSGGAILASGERVLFLARAFDQEEGHLSGGSITWSSSRDGDFAAGAFLLYDKLSVGEHLIVMTAVNSFGAVASDSVAVSVLPDGNRAPQVTLSNPWDSTSVNPSVPVFFLATGEDFEEGVLPTERFYWQSSRDGYFGQGSVLEYADLSLGPHTITVVGVDSHGAAGADSIRFFVDPASANTAPIVSIVYPADGSDFALGTPVLLSGAAADPEEGQVPTERLSWYSSLDGMLGSGDYMLREDLSEGEHTLRLLALDSKGLVGSAEVTIQVVLGGNISPSVQINNPADGASFALGAAVTFTGTASDPEEGVLTGSALSWVSSIDGVLGSGSSLNVDQLSPGRHRILFQAVDSRGAASADSITIALSNPPVVAITSPVEGESFPIGAPVTFNGSANDPEEGVLPAESLVWRSSLVGQPIGMGASFTVNNLGTGTHRITLTATDRTGVSDSAAVTIHVVSVPDSLFAWVETGAAALQVRIDPLAQKAYVTNNTANSVSIIELAAFTELDEIPVGLNPVGLDLAPSLGRVYIASSGDNNVAVISGSTVQQTINVGFEPTGVAVGPDESRVFVSNANSASVSVISTATGEVDNTFINVGNSPRNMLVPPGSGLLLVSNYGGEEAGADQVAAVNYETGLAVPITVADKPLGLAATPDGQFAFVANSGSGSVSLISVAGLAEVLKISVGQGPTACAVTPDNSQVYVVNSLTRSISIIDLLSKTVVETIPDVGTEPYDIAFYERSSSELFALVTDRALGRVWVFLVR